MIQGSSWCPCLDRRGGQEEVNSKLNQPVVLWRQSGMDLSRTQMSAASHPHVRQSPGLLREAQRETGTLRSWAGTTNVRFPSFGDNLFSWSTFTARSVFDQIPPIKISIDPLNVPNLKDFTQTSLWQEMLWASSKPVRIFHQLQSTWVWHSESQHW